MLMIYTTITSGVRYIERFYLYYGN